MGQVMDHCAMCSGETVANESSEVQAKMRRVCWVPLESNPEVLNGFAWKVGLPKTWGFVDMYGLDPELLAMVPPGCCAVTLLSQCSPAIAKFKEGQRKRIEVEGQKISPDLVYLKQYVGNACGTIACIHSLANSAELVGLPSSSHLGRYLASIAGKSPESAGEMLAEAADLHQASEACAVGGQTSAPAATARVDHHFIAFVERGGCIYELDGCKAFAVNHGPVKGDFLSSVAQVVKANFVDPDPDNVHLNMMALVQN
mmetsp:Transcript_92184/g.264204  ORF Transcript_92184/g.264204 Transcript_92184/m.264204 type:complete len:257 (-) Transcript_92184:70-840(-)